MSQEKIYVYCFKSEILRLDNSRKLHVHKGTMWLDENVVNLFPHKFKPAIPPEDVPETPSDADDNAQVDPPADDAGEDEKVEPDSTDSTDNTDSTDDPPADPLAEAMAEVADLSDNKKALETYGRKFGIELNRRKSLKNMKIDLEKALTELMSLE